jgi:hypothetical protein
MGCGVFVELQIGYFIGNMASLVKTEYEYEG